MLFKILHGDKTRISTDITPYHEGYCYVTYDGDFYVDMNNRRVKLNAKDAETLDSHSFDEFLLQTDMENIKAYVDEAVSSSKLSASVDDGVFNLTQNNVKYTSYIDNNILIIQ